MHLVIYAQAQVAAKMNGRWVMPNYDSLYRGKDYVDFSLSTLDGRKLTNDLCKGKIVVMDFWFEGCAGCRKETGDLNALYDSLKHDPAYEFVAITFDAPETLPEFLEKNHMHYPVASVLQNEELHRMNYKMGCPSKIVLDRQGKIAFISQTATAENLLKEIRKLQ